MAVIDYDYHYGSHNHQYADYLSPIECVLNFCRIVRDHIPGGWLAAGELYGRP
jgi:hypothetical protein